MIKNKNFHTLSLFAGIFSMIYGVWVYEKTFINPIYLISFLIVLSTIYSPIVNKAYIRLYNRSNYFYSFFHSIFSIGFFSISMFLILNYNLSSEEYDTKNFRIVKTGVNGGRSQQSYGFIRYDNVSKKILFKKGTQINISDKIQLDISKGLFGIYVIKSKTIIN